VHLWLYSALRLAAYEELEVHTVIQGRHWSISCICFSSKIFVLLCNLLGLSYQRTELVIYHVWRLVSYKVEKIDNILWFVYRAHIIRWISGSVTLSSCHFICHVFQLWDQDIAPLKRSLSSSSRRLSRISQMALVIHRLLWLLTYRLQITLGGA